MKFPTRDLDFGDAFKFGSTQPSQTSTYKISASDLEYDFSNAFK